MLVGRFVHGVMNTDNTTISGETIDYGPCAHGPLRPATVFSSIDHGGRYAYGNQPAIVQWNLACLAEALLRHRRRRRGCRRGGDDQLREAARPLPGALEPGHGREVGLAEVGEGGSTTPTVPLFDDLLRLLHHHRVDYTSSSVSSPGRFRGDDAPACGGVAADGAGVPDDLELDGWLDRWRSGRWPAGAPPTLSPTRWTP